VSTVEATALVNNKSRPPDASQQKTVIGARFVFSTVETQEAREMEQATAQASRMTQHCRLEFQDKLELAGS
jgi:hypothetical protein